MVVPGTPARLQHSLHCHLAGRLCLRQHSTSPADNAGVRRTKEMDKIRNKGMNKRRNERGGGGGVEEEKNTRQ